ncbi:MAG: SDR family NAD(P)-dependent oxidoreductase [Polyangiales bacterium]
MSETASTKSDTRTWFITGASRGIGRALVERALSAGENVVATARRPEALKDLAAAHPHKCRVLPLDVRDAQAARVVVEQAIACFGQLDVVVNNAGYGLVAAIEEADEAAAREQLDTNFFGALWVTQAVLPHLRARGRGHIVQISTVGAVGTMPMFGLYNASKWALEGFSEALAAEVAGFGVRVTIAELSSFATDWAWNSMQFADNDPAYDTLREQTFGTPKLPWDMKEKQNDPAAQPSEAAQSLYAHVTAESGPLRLLVGAEAPEQVQTALSRRRDDYQRNKGFTWPR